MPIIRLQHSGRTAAPGTTVQRLRRILPRSRHLPVASTDGSLTENPNKTAVRLWTACSARSISCVIRGPERDRGCLAFLGETGERKLSTKATCRSVQTGCKRPPFLFSLTEAAPTSILAASLTPPRGSQCATSCCWSFWLPCPPPTPGSDNHASGQSHLGGRNQRARSGSFDSWQSCHDPSRRESPHVCAATQS